MKRKYALIVEAESLPPVWEPGDPAMDGHPAYDLLKMAGRRHELLPGVILDRVIIADPWENEVLGEHLRDLSDEIMGRSR